MKKVIFKQIIIIAICVIVMALATFAFFSQAWFATNRRVDSNNTTITSSSPSASLFIRAASDTTTQYLSSISDDRMVSLYPISTADLKNWYFASAFSYNIETITDTNYTYTVKHPIATGYTRINSFIDADEGTYYNSYEQRNTTAYYKSIVNLYTVNGNLDVYIKSINVEYIDNNIASRELLNCLRLGIMVNNTKVFIFAPVEESGTGNSYGASANTIYYIRNGLLTVGTDVLTSITDYSAQLITGATDLYEPIGNHNICTATEQGIDVTFFAWLEGTDAQALYGLADNDIKGIKITITYVGVEPNE